MAASPSINSKKKSPEGASYFDVALLDFDNEAAMKMLVEKVKKAEKKSKSPNK